MTLAVLLGTRGSTEATVAGGGPKKSDCFAEFDGVTATKGVRVDCQDGDPTCDNDGLCNGSCEFSLRLCVNQKDIPQCTSPGLASAPTVKGATLPAPGSLTADSCSGAFTSVVVQTKPGKGKHKGKPRSLTIRMTAKAASGKPKVDKDKLVLRCLPRTGACPAQCTCAGGTPTKLSFTTVVGQGACGKVDSDTTPNFLPLACAGLYFGGSQVSTPLPSKIPDMGTSILNVACQNKTLTLSATDAATTGGNRCSGGTNHGGTCTTDTDCPGGVCKQLNCTKAGCLFGAPLPIPNGTHGFSIASTCVINVVAQDAAGKANCADGTATAVHLPLTSQIFLEGDLLPNRCSGGTTAGAKCATAGGACPGGGTCVNDTGRCKGGTNAGTACTADGNCTGGSCETGVCAGGTNDGQGCITASDCAAPGVCKTLIQPCPICDPTSHLCAGGPNDGLACTPSDTAIDGDFPTTHDCPPDAPQKIGDLPIGFVLDTGSETKTAVDLLTQTNVFCGYCRDQNTKKFANPAVACTTDADCAAVTGATSCGQQTAGGFSQANNNVSRTITETGAPAGPLTTGGPTLSSTLVSVFCIPPTFNQIVDGAADLPGPGAVALPGTMKLVP